MILNCICPLTSCKARWPWTPSELPSIYDIKDWLLLNMLKFNTSKTDLYVIGSQQLSKLNLPLAMHVEQSEIITEESITNLGVVMDQYLKLDRHANKVFKVRMFHLRNISKIRRSLTTEACKLLIHALVTSRLDYCNSILYGCNQSTLPSSTSTKLYCTSCL